MGDDENTKRILDTLGEHRKEQREENRMLHKRVTDESDKLRETMTSQGERIAKVETKVEALTDDKVASVSEAKDAEGTQFTPKGVAIIISAVFGGLALLIGAAVKLFGGGG